MINELKRIIEENVIFKKSRFGIVKKVYIDNDNEIKSDKWIFLVLKNKNVWYWDFKLEYWVKDGTDNFKEPQEIIDKMNLDYEFKEQ